MTTAQPFSRPVSETERAYVELGRHVALPVIQHVVACEGDLPLDALREAVAAAAEACPDARARLRGGRWVAVGGPPPVRELAAGAPDGPLPGALRDPFCAVMRPERDPLAEVVLLRASPAAFSLVFRVFHGVMDGQAVLAFVANVFRHLRGEPLAAQRGTRTDREFLRDHGAARRPLAVRPDCRPGFAGLARREDLYWLRRRVAGKWLGTTARAAQAVAACYGDGPVRLLIPASVRRLAPAAAPSGNLTLPLYLEVAGGEDWAAAFRRLGAALQAGEDLNLAATEAGLPPWLPSAAVQLALAGLVRWQARTGRFFCAATLTNLGRLDLAAYSAPGARATTLYALPTHQPLVPLSLVITELAGHVEIVASGYAGVVPPADAARVLDRVAAALA